MAQVKRVYNIFNNSKSLPFAFIKSRGLDLRECLGYRIPRTKNSPSQKWVLQPSALRVPTLAGKGRRKNSMYWNKGLRGSPKGLKFLRSRKGLGRDGTMAERIYIPENHIYWEIPSPKTPLQKSTHFFPKSLLQTATPVFKTPGRWFKVYHKHQHPNRNLFIKTPSTLNHSICI